MKSTRRRKRQAGGVPPWRPHKTAATATERPRPSIEELVAAIKGMKVKDILWLRAKIDKLIKQEG